MTSRTAVGEAGTTTSWEADLCIFQGATRSELLAKARGWLDRLSGPGAPPLPELAWSLARSLTPGSLRLAIVASSVEELNSRLAETIDRLADPDLQRIHDGRGVFFSERPLARDSRLAFVFPGDGSPYLGMLADLRERFGTVRRWFELADAVAADNHREPYTDILYPGPLTTPRERRRAEHSLRRLENSAAAVLAGNQALLELMGELGVEAEAVIGHSLGDWSALAAAGVTRTEQFLRAMDRALALPGHVTRSSARMALAVATREEVEEVLRGVGGEVHIAMHNGPRRVIIAGHKRPMTEVLQQLAERGVSAYRLPFVRAAHTPMTAAMCEPLGHVFSQWRGTKPATEVWSCVTAQPYPREFEAIRSLAVENMIRPVEFVATIEHAYSAGLRLFVECGVGGQLADCINSILGDRPHLAVPLDLRQRPGLVQLLHALGALAAEGITPNLEPLFATRQVAAETPDPVVNGAARSEVVRQFLTATSAALQSHATLVSETLAANDAFTQRFLEVETQALAQLLGPATVAVPLDAPAAQPMLPPFLDEVLQLEPGRRVTARHRFDPARQPYLLDHSMGSFAPQHDESVEPLRMAPLTMSIELMAEGGSLLYPGRPFCGARNIVARRPVIANGHAELRITAEAGEPGWAMAAVLLVENGQELLCAEGEMHYGDYPDAPAATPFEPRSARPAELTAAELYARRVMFHGPCYHGVSHLTCLGEDGIVGRLRALPPEMLLTGRIELRTCCDPALLDAMGQLFGYWPLEQYEVDQVVFPTHLDQLELYGPPLPPGTEVEATVCVTQATKKRLTGQIELSRDGRLWAKVTAWRFWRFNWPLELVRFNHDPLERFATGTLPEVFPALALDGLASAFIDQPRPLEWLDVVVRAALTKDELARFESLPEPGRRREQFYLGRLAAKDAVRRWLCGGMRVVPAANRISIQQAESGAPRVAGSALDTVDMVPYVSLSHSGGTAAAVVGDLPVGLDLERIETREASFYEAAFTPAERELLGPDEAWLTRGWCAKEALAKALETGLGSPREVVITAVDHDTGALTVTRGETTATAATAVSARLAAAVVRLATATPARP